MKDPETPAEWQEAVDAAEFFLGVDSAVQYGLLSGGPRVHADRCREILKRGVALGYKPAPISKLCEKFIGNRT